MPGDELLKSGEGSCQSKGAALLADEAIELLLEKWEPKPSGTDNALPSVALDGFPTSSKASKAVDSLEIDVVCNGDGCPLPSDSKSPETSKQVSDSCLPPASTGPAPEQIMKAVAQTITESAKEIGTLAETAVAQVKLRGTEYLKELANKSGELLSYLSIQSLIKDLDSDDWKTRDAAEKELKRMPPNKVLPLCLKEYATCYGNSSLEQERRLERVIKAGLRTNLAATELLKHDRSEDDEAGEEDQGILDSFEDEQKQNIVKYFDKRSLDDDERDFCQIDENRRLLADAKAALGNDAKAVARLARFEPALDKAEKARADYRKCFGDWPTLQRPKRRDATMRKEDLCFFRPLTMIRPSLMILISRTSRASFIANWIQNY